MGTVHCEYIRKLFSHSKFYCRPPWMVCPRTFNCFRSMQPKSVFTLPPARPLEEITETDAVSGSHHRHQSDKPSLCRSDLTKNPMNRLSLELWMQCGLVVPHNNLRADIRRKLKFGTGAVLGRCTRPASGWLGDGGLRRTPGLGQLSSPWPLTFDTVAMDAN